MKTFDELWRDIEERSQRWCIPIVQDREELRHVFNLIKDCKGYLEIGTAEGNGLYVLSHSVKEPFTIIDYGEKHTSAPREEVLAYLRAKKNRVTEVLGNSHNPGNAGLVQVADDELWKRDVVFIDAGHTYEDVIADAAAYGHLALKYIIFHDIQLPDVRKAYEWYKAQNPQFKASEFINSETYGYGILEVC